MSFSGLRRNPVNFGENINLTQNKLDTRRFSDWTNQISSDK